MRSPAPPLRGGRLSRLRTILIASAILTMIAQLATVGRVDAAEVADPLPRAYQVDSVVEFPDGVELGNVLALSADGTTAVHLSAQPDDEPVLVATNVRTGSSEVVGLGLGGQPVPRVDAAAVSADGRTVAYLARGANAAELGLPADADPYLDLAIFVRDRLAGAMVWVQVPDLGVPASHHRLRGLSLSEDGRRLAVEISLPLPAYSQLSSPEGILVASLRPDADPDVRIVTPEDLVAPGADLAAAQPSVREFTLSGDAAVLAVNAYRDSAPIMLRFDAASGAALPGDRALSLDQYLSWAPNLDRTGQRTALRGGDASLVVADLSGGPESDVALSEGSSAPYVSGDGPFVPDDVPFQARLVADGSTVVFVRAGALWTQSVPGGAPVLASPGLEGRIADPVFGEIATYPDAVTAYASSSDAAMLAFTSASSAFVAPRTEAPQPVRLYRSVPLDAPAPVWPEGAALAAEPGATSVTVSWPAATGTVASYEVSVDSSAVASVPAPTTETVLSGLTPGATIDIAVVARDADGRTSSALAGAVTLLDELPPGAAPLSAVSGPGARVHLVWESSTVAGLTGYRVLRDGQRLADVAAADTTYDDTTVAAGAQHTYQVTVLRGHEELPLTRAATVQIDQLALTEAVANLPRVPGTPFVALGQNVTVAILGAPGFAGSADLVVRTENEPSQQVTVALSEEAPGRYRATWTVAEGIVEVTSIVLHLADGAGNTVDAAPAGLPAAVGGLIRVDVAVPDGEPDGIRLQVWSDTTSSGLLGQIKQNGVVAVPVVPATDHRLTTRRSDGLDGTDPQTVAVSAGEAIDVAMAPYAAASLRVTVARPDGAGVADIPVVVTARTGPRAVRTDGNGQVSIEHLDAGTEVSAQAQLPAAVRTTWGLAAIPAQTLTLSPGANSVTLAADGMGTVTITGSTKDITGTALQATVSLRQTIDGVGVSYTTRSAADGTWSAQVFGGTTTVVSASRAGQTTPEVTVEDAAVPADLVFPAVSGYVVRPKLFTVSVTGARTEQAMDFESNGLYATSLVAGALRLQVTATEVPVQVPAGTTIEFCAGNVRRGHSRGCVTAVAGESPDVSLTLELREGARVTGDVLNSDGSPANEVIAYTVRGEGVAVSGSVSGSALEVSVPGGGTYVLSISGRSGSLTRLVTVADGQVLDLGDLRLSSDAGLVRGEGSGFWAVSDEVLPGGLAHLRAEIAFADPARTGSARLVLPPLTSVPDDGVLRDGEPVAFSAEEGAIVIPLPAAESRSVSIYVRAPQTGGEELSFVMSVSSDDVTAPLGQASVRSGVVTIDVPARSQTGRVTANGLAPAGSRVTLRDGDVVVAEADAGPNGRWAAVVDLGTAGDDAARHVLRATASTGDTELASEPAIVTVDPHAGVLESVTMSGGGQVQTFDAADGVARFPWVWRNTAITVRATFTGPVTDPRARLGLHESALEPVAGQPGVYVAVMTPLSSTVGDLAILYTPGQDRPLLPVPPAPDPADGLFDPADAVVEDPVTDGDTVSQQFTVALPGLGGGASLRVKMSVTALPGYAPSPSEQAASRASGLPVYGPVFTADDPASIGQTGTWSVTSTAIVDLDILAGQAPQAPLTQSLAAAGFITGAARIGFEGAFVGVTAGDSYFSTLTAGDKYGALNALMDLANKCQDGAQGQIYRNALDRLMTRALQLDAYSAVSAGASLALAPATFGIGTVGLWAVTWAIGKAIEVPLNNDIEALGREMASDESCQWRRTDSPQWSPYGPDAEITYRFDPSGFVYEGLADRRVEGVTATVLYAPTLVGPWQPWDAAAHGDRNPQLTDVEGRYGWDVPEGWWKVVYTKDGYLPAESWPMQVLPPRLDVNVTLVRADLSTVESIIADGDGLTVTFTQPMRAEQVRAGMLTVTTGDGEPIGGQWSAISAQAAPPRHPHAAEPLAMAFRFDAEQFTGDVTVAVSPLAQDHVARAVAGGIERTLTVAWNGPDTAAPQVSVTGVVDGGLYRLGAAPDAGCATADAGSGVATEATVTVTGGNDNGVGVFTATCSGAVDVAGNVAPPVSATFSVTYVFDGFLQPVDNGATNKARAGQAIPIKWRLTDANGVPVTDLARASLTAATFDCATSAVAGDIEEYASGGSGLQNLGDGYYQLNWKAPRSYANSCRILSVNLGEGTAVVHTARFQFR